MEITYVKEKYSTSTVQSIKMLPVIPRSKILPETNNVNYTLRKITEKCKNTIEENMSKYAFYYVYAAIGMLPSKLEQSVTWKNDCF